MQLSVFETVTIVFRSSIHLSIYFIGLITTTPWGNVLKFGAIVQLDSKNELIRFQWSKFKVAVTLQNIIEHKRFTPLLDHVGILDSIDYIEIDDTSPLPFPKYKRFASQVCA